MVSVFISDLHLSDDTREMTRLFCEVLALCPGRVDRLYILGDFFDVWIGDDDPGSTGSIIIGALQQATQAGLSVFITRGNRDFLLGRRFLKQSGCQLLPDLHVLDLYGKRTLLMHGDTLCTEDRAYQRARLWSRRWIFQQLFLMQSIKRRRAIASRYRKASTDYTRNTPRAIMDVTPATVTKMLRKYQARQLIHGHTHRPAIHTLSLDGQPAERSVLPDWHTAGGALICRADGSSTLATFSKAHEFLEALESRT